MSQKKIYVETDRHGNYKFVTRKRHSGSDRMTEEERLLIEENESLRSRLSYAEEREHNTRIQYEALANDHYHCRNVNARVQALENEIRRIREKYENEQDRTERLEEKIRLMKRTSHDGYRQRYEEKASEAEALRTAVHDQDGLIRLQEVKIAAKDQEISKRNRKIIYLREYLRGLGYLVEG